MGGLAFGAETGYLLAGKVRSIIGDDSVGEAEVMHYVLSEEPDNLLPVTLESGTALTHLVK